MFQFGKFQAGATCLALALIIITCLVLLCPPKKERFQNYLNEHEDIFNFSSQRLLFSEDTTGKRGTEYRQGEYLEDQVVVMEGGGQ